MTSPIDFPYVVRAEEIAEGASPACSTILSFRSSFDHSMGVARMSTPRKTYQLTGAGIAKGAGGVLFAHGHIDKQSRHKSNTTGPLARQLTTRTTTSIESGKKACIDRNKDHPIGIICEASIVNRFVALSLLILGKRTGRLDK